MAVDQKINPLKVGSSFPGGTNLKTDLEPLARIVAAAYVDYTNTYYPSIQAALSSLEPQPFLSRRVSANTSGVVESLSNPVLDVQLGRFAEDSVVLAFDEDEDNNGAQLPVRQFTIDGGVTGLSLGSAVYGDGILVPEAPTTAIIGLLRNNASLHGLDFGTTPGEVNVYDTSSISKVIGTGIIRLQSFQARYIGEPPAGVEVKKFEPIATGGGEGYVPFGPEEVDNYPAGIPLPVGTTRARNVYVREPGFAPVPLEEGVEYTLSEDVPPLLVFTTNNTPDAGARVWGDATGGAAQGGGGNATPLVAPGNRQASPAGTDLLSAQSLTASSVSGATGYRLFYSPTENGLYTLLADNLSTPSYQHTGRTAGQPAYYKWQTIGDGTTYTSSGQSPAVAAVWKNIKLCFDGNSILVPLANGGYANLAASIVARCNARLVAAGDIRTVVYDLTDGITENVSIAGQTEQDMVTNFADMAATVEARYTCVAVSLERYNYIRGYTSTVTAQQAFDKFVEYDQLIAQSGFVAHIAYTTPPDKAKAVITEQYPEYRTRPDFAAVQAGIATRMSTRAANSNRLFLADIARYTGYDPENNAESTDGIHPNQNAVDNFYVAECAEHAFMQFAYGIPQPAPATSAPISYLSYNKSSWADLSDFTLLSGTTLGLTGGKLQAVPAVDGPPQYNQGFRFKKAILADNFTMSATVEILGKSGTSYGVGVGLATANTYGGAGAVARFGIFTSGGGNDPNSGRAIFEATTADGYPMLKGFAPEGQAQYGDIGDFYTITYSQQNGATTASLQKQGGGSNATAPYTYAADGPGLGPPNNPFLPNTGYPTIFLFGSTIRLHNITWQINEKIGAKLLLDGDSKTQLYNGGTIAGRYANRLEVYYGAGEVVNLGGGYDRTTEGLLLLDMAKQLRPKNVVLHRGSNNKRSGGSLAAWQSDHQQQVAAYESVGTVVWHMLMFNEEALDFSDYNDWLIATYPARIINVGTLPLSSYEAPGSKVHPGPAAQQQIADAIYNTIGPIA